MLRHFFLAALSAEKGRDAHGSVRVRVTHYHMCESLQKVEAQKVEKGNLEN